MPITIQTMIPSIRRVVTASFALFALVFAVSFASTNFSICTNAVGCIASVNAYDTNVAVSGAQSSPVDLVMLNEILRVNTLYAAVIFLVLLMLLEFIQPHFVKKVRRSVRRRQQN